MNERLLNVFRKTECQKQRAKLPLIIHQRETVTRNNFATLPVPFPWKLWQLLEDTQKHGTEDIVTWLQNGDGFVILKPEKFESCVMKTYFDFSCYAGFSNEVR